MGAYPRMRLELKPTGPPPLSVLHAGCRVERGRPGRPPTVAATRYAFLMVAGPRRMRIPVFVSTPTALSRAQQAQRSFIERALDRRSLEPRTIGETDYPDRNPLREVYAVGRHCSGGVILGFEQMRVLKGINKPETAKEEIIGEPWSLPTPWNQLEGGILFGLGLPLLIFKEENVQGGLFDPGVTDVFLYSMPTAVSRKNHAFEQVLDKWHARVMSHYYRDDRPHLMGT